MVRRTQELFQILKSWQLTYAIVIHLLPDDVAFDLSVGLVLDLETNLTKINLFLVVTLYKNVKKNQDTVKAINYIDSSNLYLFFNSGTSILHPSIN